MTQLRLTWAVIIVMIATASASLALLFEPPWLVYTNLPFPVLNSPVKAGNVVVIQVSRCSTARSTQIYTVSHALRGPGLPIILPATTVPIDPGCGSRVVATNKIPEGTPPGQYRLIGYGEIQGIIRSHSVQWHSQYFEVTP